MTVKELIEKLKLLPEDKDVRWSQNIQQQGGDFIGFYSVKDVVLKSKSVLLIKGAAHYDC